MIVAFVMGTNISRIIIKDCYINYKQEYNFIEERLCQGVVKYGKELSPHVSETIVALTG